MYDKWRTLLGTVVHGYNAPDVILFPFYANELLLASALALRLELDLK